MNQLKAGATLNYTVIVLNILVGLLYTPFLLRMLGQSDYGIYSLVASVISYLTLLDLGFGNAIIRYTAKFRAEGKTREQYELFGMFLILYTVIGLIAMVLGYGLYTHVDAWFGNTMTVEELDKTRIMLLLLIFNLSFTFPMSVFGSIILAYERFVFPKVINILRILLNTGIMILLLEMGYRVIAMVVLQTVFNLLTLVCNYFYCRYKLHIKIWFRKFRWGFLKEVTLYSFWIFLSVIMDRIYWNTGQFVLAVYVNTATVAVFAIAIQLSILYMSFSTSISGVFLPKVTSMVTNNDNRKEISSLFIRTGRIQYIVMAFILSGFVVFGHDFIRLWAGNGYEEAYLIALLFFLALTVPMIQNLGVTILQARNQMKFRALSYLGIGVFSFLFQLLLSKHYGAIGCTWAIVGALLIGQGVVMNLYYHFRQGLDIIAFWKEIAKMSVVPILMCLIAKGLLAYFPLDNWKSLATGVIIFMVVYLPLFCRFGMNRYEFSLFMAPVRKVMNYLKL